MIETGYLYIVPLGFLVLWLFLQLLLSQNLKKEQPFQNDYMNLFHNLSDVAPFKWFIEDNPYDKKVQEINHLIIESGFKNKMNYQSFVTMQLSLFGLAMVLFGLINIALEPLIQLLSLLLNLDSTGLINNSLELMVVRIGILLVLILPSVLVKPYMKRKAKKHEIEFIKDLPLLQLFIILMLRSDRTISDVMYVLSTTNSTYQEAFQKAYLIYLRDPDEAFDYLELYFDGTKIIETIYTLRDYAEYDKEESIVTLENNQEQVEEYTKQSRKKIEAGKNLFATASISFPFLSIMLLGAAPIGYWALQLISDTM